MNESRWESTREIARRLRKAREDCEKKYTDYMLGDIIQSGHKAAASMLRGRQRMWPKQVREFCEAFGVDYKEIVKGCEDGLRVGWGYTQEQKIDMLKRGILIRDARLSEGLSRSEAAKLIGISTDTLGDYENAIRDIPEMDRRLINKAFPGVAEKYEWED